MKKKVLAAFAVLGMAATVWTAQHTVTQPGYTVLYDDAGRSLLVVANGSNPTLPVPPQEGALLYRQDEDKFYQYQAGTWTSALTIATLTGNVVGDVTGNVTGNVTGVIGGVSSGLFLSDVAVTGSTVGASGQCGGVVTNAGDDDGATYTLPDNPSIGCSIVVQAVVAQALTLASASGETLQLGPDACTAGTITLNAIGDGGLVVAVTGGSGAVWVMQGDAGSTGGTCNDA